MKITSTKSASFSERSSHNLRLSKALGDRLTKKTDEMVQAFEDLQHIPENTDAYAKALVRTFDHFVRTRAVAELYAAHLHRSLLAMTEPGNEDSLEECVDYAMEQEAIGVHHATSKEMN